MVHFILRSLSIFFEFTCIPELHVPKKKAGAAVACEYDSVPRSLMNIIFCFKS